MLHVELLEFPAGERSKTRERGQPLDGCALSWRRFGVSRWAAWSATCRVVRRPICGHPCQVPPRARMIDLDRGKAGVDSPPGRTAGAFTSRLVWPTDVLTSCSATARGRNGRGVKHGVIATAYFELRRARTSRVEAPRLWGTLLFVESLEVLAVGIRRVSGLAIPTASCGGTGGEHVQSATRAAAGGGAQQFFPAGTSTRLAPIEESIMAAAGLGTGCRVPASRPPARSRPRRRQRDDREFRPAEPPASGRRGCPRFRVCSVARDSSNSTCTCSWHRSTRFSRTLRHGEVRDHGRRRARGFPRPADPQAVMADQIVRGVARLGGADAIVTTYVGAPRARWGRRQDNSIPERRFRYEDGGLLPARARATTGALGRRNRSRQVQRALGAPPQNGFSGREPRS